MLMDTPLCDFGWKAPDFTLKDPGGKAFTMSEHLGDKGLLIAFICNHCPYVLAIVDRLVADARILAEEGIGFAAICSNDAVSYPEDSFPMMQEFAERHGFGFPYLHDESQEVARSYDAVCTPDIYGVSSTGMIKYHGRLDEGRMNAPSAQMPRELVEAMRLIARTGEGPEVQHPSMGCSIKWMN